MNINTYRQLSCATRENIGNYTAFDQLLDSIHCVLGMTSEYNDEYMTAVSEVNEGEELGDLCWYMAEYCNVWNILTPDVYQIKPDTTLNVDRIPVIIGKLADLDKAALAYNRDIPFDKRAELINELWATVWMLIIGLGYEVEDIFKTNLNKLYQRYKGKFTAHAANNRDLEKELAILEEGLVKN